jgi:hypothetical protein
MEGLWNERFPSQIPERLVMAERLESDTFNLEGHDLVAVEVIRCVDEIEVATFNSGKVWHLTLIDAMGIDDNPAFGGLAEDFGQAHNRADLGEPTEFLTAFWRSETPAPPPMRRPRRCASPTAYPRLASLIFLAPHLANHLHSSLGLTRHGDEGDAPPLSSGVSATAVGCAVPVSGRQRRVPRCALRRPDDRPLPHLPDC